MFDRLANGFELAMQSWRVLRKDKELIVFPLISGLACLAVLATFALPLWNSSYMEVFLEEEQIPADPLLYGLMFLFYFANYFVILFFNSALVACAIIRFRGENPTISDGINAACDRLPQILGWALVSATVGVILKIIESKSEKAGKFAAALLGTAWTVATYFVVPVLVVEKAGPGKAMKRSLAILRKSWGEALTANFGLGIVTTIITMLAVFPIGFGIVAIGTDNVVLGSVAIGAGVCWIVLVALVSSALDAILVAALYLYAAEETVPKKFDETLLREAF